MDVYTIHAGAALGPEWVEWFDGAEIRTRPDGTGILVASVSDQAMLFGLLLRLRDLGIPLLGVYPGAAPTGRYRQEASVGRGQETVLNERVHEKAATAGVHETAADRRTGS